MTTTTKDSPRRLTSGGLRRWLMVGSVLAAVLATVAVWGIVVWRGERLPLLSQAAFDAAWQTWQARGADSYALQVTVAGRQPGTYRVVVEQGLAVSATLNDRPLTSLRTVGTWSVPGMFETIRWDLKNQADLHLMLRASFDQRGVPVQYERIELRSGAHDALTWAVDHWDSNE